MPAPEDHPRPDTSPAAGGDRLLLSDAERDEGVRALERACVEGRLTLGEFSERVEGALGARTRGDLAPLLADLPTASPPVPGEASAPAPAPAPGASRPSPRFSLSILGEHQHLGRWVLPPRLVHLSLLGRTRYDLSEAELSSADSELTVISLLGSVEVHVPEDVSVEVDDFSVLGSRQVDSGHRPPPAGAPRLHLRVLALLGAIVVTRGAGRGPGWWGPRHPRHGWGMPPPAPPAPPAGTGPGVGWPGPPEGWSEPAEAGVGWMLPSRADRRRARRERRRMRRHL